MAMSIRQAVTTPEGDGVMVSRLMPVTTLRNFDPFVLMDHFNIQSGAGFPDHPHRGFEAITYMFSGGMQHADNLGNRSTVKGGGAQRFTAGRGIVHSEMPDGAAAGIQLWINLPRSLKGVDPEYQQVDADEFPTEAFDGGELKTVVGEGSPLKLRTDVQYIDLQLHAGGQYVYAVPQEMRGFVYVVAGSVSVDADKAGAGFAAFIEQAGAITISAEEASRLLVIVGKPHHEPIFQHGPFVD